MEKTFQKFTSKIVVVNRKDIDTDLIIPAEFLSTTEKKNLGKGLFSILRKEDKNFPVINGQRVLIAGKNFGCGSSREHAVWALKESGIDVVISSGFADIFRGNSEKNQLLAITLNEEIVQNLIQEKEIIIDLENQSVEKKDGEKFHFELPNFTKKRLLENLSDFDYLQGFSQEISNFNNANPL
jgi:3-isopropylmalate dehydratase small subunit